MDSIGERTKVLLKLIGRFNLTEETDVNNKMAAPIMYSTIPLTYDIYIYYYTLDWPCNVKIAYSAMDRFERSNYSNSRDPSAY